MGAFEDGNRYLLEGNELLNQVSFSSKEVPPFIGCSNKIIIDDTVINKPTCVLGNSGTGKTTFIIPWIQSILNYSRQSGDNVIIFAAKRDILNFADRDDIIIRLDNEADKESNRWNLLQELLELQNEGDVTLIAKEISHELFEDQHSLTQPFFTIAPREIFERMLLFLYCLEKQGKRKVSNKDILLLSDYMMSLNNGKYGWECLQEMHPQHFSFLSSYLGKGDSHQALGILGELQAMVGETFFGSFAQKGDFSTIKALREGGKRIFLYYDYSKSNRSGAKLYKIIINLLIKQALANESKRKNFFILDEFSLLPHLDLINALSYGRELGFRILVTLQSARLLANSYSIDEAKALLSLFYNVFCFYVNDPLSRDVIKERYGKGRYKVYFDDYSGTIQSQVSNEDVVTDFYFSKIVKPGNCIVSCPDISPNPFYMMLNHK